MSALIIGVVPVSGHDDAVRSLNGGLCVCVPARAGVESDAVRTSCVRRTSELEIGYVEQMDSERSVWRRSSRCDAGQCVEMAVFGAQVALRDSKDPDGPWLRFDHATWAGLVDSVRAGAFDA